MISINATLILQVVHIIILILILNRLMFRPILRLTVERKKYFRSTKDEINEILHETERLREEFESVQRDARKDASQEAAKIRGTGMNLAQDHIEESKKAVSSIRIEAEADAEKETDKVKVHLPGEAKTLADEITERLMGRRLMG
jgi:F-type H+-transporting ATPase subunit b